MTRLILKIDQQICSCEYEDLSMILRNQRNQVQAFIVQCDICNTRVEIPWDKVPILASVTIPYPKGHIKDKPADPPLPAFVPIEDGPRRVTFNQDEV